LTYKKNPYEKYMNKCVQIGIKEFDIFAIAGTVKAAQNISDRQYSVGYSVLLGGNFLDSSESQTTSFFLANDDGREDYVSLDADLPLREGHRVRVLYCGAPNSHSGSPIALLNETTGKLATISSLEFQKRFQAIGQASFMIRILLACLVIAGGIAIWVTARAPTGLVLDSGRTAGYVAVGAFVYLMYEGLIGSNFYLANRLNMLNDDMEIMTKNALQTKT
jgi:hypothetical protein